MSTKSKTKRNQLSKAFDKMSCVELNLWMETVDELLSCYEHENIPQSDPFETHPLCWVTQLYAKHGGFTDCPSCLWLIIEGKSCDRFSEELFNIPRYYISHTEKWRRVRIPMLKRWRKILKAEWKRLSKDKDWGC